MHVTLRSPSWTVIEEPLRAVTVPEIPVGSASSLVDFLVCSGTSAIATRTPSAQAILTRSPTAKSESEGEAEVRLQVRRWWWFLPTVIEVGVMFAMTPDGGGVRLVDRREGARRGEAQSEQAQRGQSEQGEGEE